MAAIIRDSIDELRDAADKKTVSVLFDATGQERMVLGDRDMLKEVFVNLISNGIKYNRSGGKITVSLAEKEDVLVVDVSDTGVGIAEEDIPRVGEDFYRVKREGTAPGIGIGLAIVRKILDMHEGVLNIESKLNKGSKFSVFLPRIKKE